ncbi:MAG: flagellar motor protein MotD [Panacagrimonas sp.]
MARKQTHEEHTNHEAWAIPYGDLVTLLLALFVVMYSISSVNEGKFRVMSDALSQAFGGPPKSIRPVQIGARQQRGSADDHKLDLLRSVREAQSVGGTMRDLRNAAVFPGRIKAPIPGPQTVATGTSRGDRNTMQRIADKVEKALGVLISKKVVVVRRGESRIEIEIKTDILYPSGSAIFSSAAEPVLVELASILAAHPSALRIEGHTDNVPIATAAFPSNWELSAARASSVVRLFAQHGIAPGLMSVEGFGEFRPVESNASVEGRNRNRRVVLVAFADGADEQPDTGIAESGSVLAPAAEPTPVLALAAPGISQ